VRAAGVEPVGGGHRVVAVDRVRDLALVDKRGGLGLAVLLDLTLHDAEVAALFHLAATVERCESHKGLLSR
jgi:hypothetical protein